MLVFAAKSAAVHDQILEMPDGYDTKIFQGSAPMAAGIIQRICIARAIFGQPKILVLDEPTRNLDAIGLRALHRIISAVKSGGGIALIFTQRPSAVQGCDLLLSLNHGVQTSFGRAGDVLNGLTTNIHPLPASEGQGKQ